MAGMQDYKSTQRYRAAMAAFLREASKDPTLVQPVGQAKSTVDGAAEAGPSEPASSTGRVPYSLVYHQTLAGYVEELSSQLGSLLATIYGPVPSPALPAPMSDLDSSTRIFYAASPSEGLALASYCQHIRRWEIPRFSYPEGLSGYKAWRLQLNKFHTAESFKILQSSGYSQDTDSEIYKTIENLLQKKTLKGGGDKSSDEEMQLFEDAICLTFLQLEFAEFMAKHDEEKMIGIVQKTWKKMGHCGRQYAQDRLAAQLPDAAQELLGKALSA